MGGETRAGDGMKLIWLRTCLALTKPWFGSPALRKLGVVVPACEPSTQEGSECIVWGPPEPHEMSSCQKEEEKIENRGLGGLPRFTQWLVNRATPWPQASPLIPVLNAGLAPRTSVVIVIFLDFGAACLCVHAWMYMHIYVHECLYVYDCVHKCSNMHDNGHACICV